MRDQPLLVITGAARGIGRACAQLLSDEYRVVIVDLAGATEAARELGENCVGLTADITDAAACMDTAASVREMGKVEALVHCAGVFTAFGQRLAELSTKDWDRQLRVNLDGTFLLMRSFIPLLGDNARVVLFSSRVARTGTTRMNINDATNGHYCASKAAVSSLVKSYALELAPRGIRVNGIAPGPIATDMAADKKDGITGFVPLGRLGKPQEVADCVRFLVSAQSSYVTGAMLDVNGGMSMF